MLNLINKETRQIPGWTAVQGRGVDRVRSTQPPQRGWETLLVISRCLASLSHPLWHYYPLLLAALAVQSRAIRSPCSCASPTLWSTFAALIEYDLAAATRSPDASSFPPRTSSSHVRYVRFGARCSVSGNVAMLRTLVVRIYNSLLNYSSNSFGFFYFCFWRDRNEVSMNYSIRRSILSTLFSLIRIHGH